MLTTKCNTCIFLSNDTCYLNRDIIEVNNEKRVRGFCSFKRTNDWIKDDNFLGLEEAKNKVFKENDNITAIVSVLDETDIEKIDKELFNYSKFEEVILLFNNSKIMIYFINLLNENKMFNKWKAQYTDCSISLEQAYNDASTKVSNDWILFCKISDNFNEYDLKSIVKNSPTYASFENCPSSFLCNKFAFYEINGNVSAPFIEKINNYSKDLCQTVSQ